MEIIIDGVTEINSCICQDDTLLLPVYPSSGDDLFEIVNSCYFKIGEVVGVIHMSERIEINKPYLKRNLEFELLHDDARCFDCLQKI